MDTSGEDRREFRWRFWDDDLGDVWGGWHTVALPCAACCCDGPDDGEHLERRVYYDEDEIPVFSGHSRYEPDTRDEGWVEWRQPTS